MNPADCKKNHPACTKKKYSGDKSDIELSIGEIFLDKYEILDVLGIGNMSSVYLARCRESGRDFAVKTQSAGVLGDVKRNRLFLREIRTWIDLPEHPNLTTAFFFRTRQGRIYIFAEYVRGSSLKQLIDSQTLRNLADILDITIQVARGLRVAHEHGVIHRDIKPANIMVALDNTAKITDFGLARLSKMANETTIEANQIGYQSPSSTSGMMTPVYCSPEQYERRELDFRTDIWSFGVSIMEIFTGPPNWFCGVLAPYILNGYRKRGPRPPYPAMPIALADILEKCFKDPEKRWQSMDELVVQLKKVYEDVIGRTYNRPNLKPVFRVAKRVKYDRSSIEIGSWGDPVEWLKKAYSALGRDPTEVHNILPEWHGSWKARALADLEIFHEAKNLFTELVSSGRLDLEEDLAAIHYHMANILFNIEDFNEAVANYRCCLCIEENLYHEDHNKTRSINLASVYVQMANTYQYMRMHEMALANYKKALDQWESIQYEYQHKAQFDQAKILMNTATALTSLKSFEEAVATLDKAIEKLENLFKSEKDDEISLILAVAYNNKAYTLNQMDRFKEAVPLTQKSIRIIEKKMENESSELLGISLFKYLMQNGINLKNLEDFDNALAMYERAYKVLNPLIHEQGRSDLLPSLCMLHCNKAQILYVTGNYSDSLSLMNKALSMVNRLIHEKGRRDLIQLKLSIQSSKIRVLKSTGNYDAGLKLIEITKNGFQALCNERQENFWKDDMDRLQAEREEIKQLMTRED